MRQLFVHNLAHRGRVSIHRVATEEDPADFGTRVMPTAALCKHMKNTGFEVQEGNTDRHASAVTLDSCGWYPPAEDHGGQDAGSPVTLVSARDDLRG